MIRIQNCWNNVIVNVNKIYVKEMEQLCGKRTILKEVVLEIFK